MRASRRWPMQSSTGGNGAARSQRRTTWCSASGIVCRLLHMYVNADLAELAEGVQVALELLRPGGALVVLTFKKLEWLAVRAALAQSAPQMETVLQVRPTERELERVHTARSATLWVVTKRLSAAQRASVAAIAAVAASIEFVTVTVTVRSRCGSRRVERSDRVTVPLHAGLAQIGIAGQEKFHWCWPSGAAPAAPPGALLRELPRDPRTGLPLAVFAEEGRDAIAARAEVTLCPEGRPLPAHPAASALARIQACMRPWQGSAKYAAALEAEPFAGGAVLAPCKVPAFLDAGPSGFAAALRKLSQVASAEPLPGARVPHIRVVIDGAALLLVPRSGWDPVKKESSRDSAKQTASAPAAPRALYKAPSAAGPSGVCVATSAARYTAPTATPAPAGGLLVNLTRKVHMLGSADDATPRMPSERVRDRICRHFRSFLFTLHHPGNPTPESFAHAFPGGLAVGPVAANVFLGRYAALLRREFLVRDVRTHTDGGAPRISAIINDEAVVLFPCSSSTSSGSDGSTVELSTMRQQNAAPPPPPPPPPPPHPHWAVEQQRQQQEHSPLLVCNDPVVRATWPVAAAVQPASPVSVGCPPQCGQDSSAWSETADGCWVPQAHGEAPPDAQYYSLQGNTQWEWGYRQPA
eukprot:TRINITY_DN6549_c3_g1_i2.p1 TRINITY_DN6549_c3_g1~~TRINITY_DN6549_c3_g1_i2.p1  ORF type:complete len:639 (+),score=146.93 TRINITY_DN6549_c3_g1_i2:1036-2952(+)